MINVNRLENMVNMAQNLIIATIVNEVLNVIIGSGGKCGDTTGKHRLAKIVV